MAIRVLFLRVTLLGALLLLPALFIQAQTEPLRFVHRLTWTRDASVIRYEVVVEREDAGVYREMYRGFTESSFLEYSFPPGRYRFRVTPYDYLHRAAPTSAWMNFEVRLALVPELDHALPVYLYLDDDATHALDLSGKNLHPDAEIVLRHSGGAAIVPNTKVIHPDGSSAWLFFNNDQLTPGEYEVHIRNPGGYETRGRTIIVMQPEPIIVQIEEPEPEPEPEVKIEEPEPVPPPAPVRVAGPFPNKFLSLALMPVFPVHGEESRFFDQDNTLLGVAIRMGVRARPNTLSFGAELVSSWHAFSTPSNRLAHFSTLELNFLAQKWFPNEIMAVTFRAGGGYTLFMPDNSGIYSYLDWSYFHANTGLSFLWLINDRLFMEAGMDYSFWFTKDPAGVLRPWVGVGWRF
jgi:hypothetical protein